MQLGDVIGEVGDVAIGARILENRPEIARHGIGAGDIRRIAHGDVDPERRRARFDHGNRLGMAILIYEEPGRLGFRHPLRHGHRLCRRRRLVQKGGVGNLKPGQVSDHRLVVQQRFQPPLADLGLIRRVGRVPRRILKNVALDRGRRCRPVIPLSNHGGEHVVLLGHLAHVPKQFPFGLRLAEIQRSTLADRRRHSLVDQLVQILYAKHFEHLLHLGRRWPDMAAIGEVIGQVSAWLEGHLSLLRRCGRYRRLRP